MESSHSKNHLKYLSEELSFTQDKLEKVVAFRHWMHQNAEGHLKEFNTQAKIKQTLIELGGFASDDIKPIAGTGLIIDI